MPIGTAASVNPTVPAVTSSPVVTSQGEFQYGYHQKELEEAVDAGDVMELSRLLEERSEKINVNRYDNDGETALHRCCREGHLEIVKLLVKFGADVRLANRDGWSALHLAAYGGHHDITLYLISAFKR